MLLNFFRLLFRHDDAYKKKTFQGEVSKRVHPVDRPDLDITLRVLLKYIVFGSIQFCNFSSKSTRPRLYIDSVY